MQANRDFKPEERIANSRNETYSRDGVLYVILKGGFVTKTDDTPEIREVLSKHTFCHDVVRRSGYCPRAYARTSVILETGRRTVAMHGILVGYAREFRTGKRMECDHINGDSMDNRQCNLRIVTSSVNRINLSKPRKDNKTGITGVSWNEPTNTFLVQWKVASGVGRSRRFPVFRYGSKEAAFNAAKKLRIDVTHSLPFYTKALEV